MKTVKFKFKDLGEKVVLKTDLLSFNGEKVLKKAGSIGTIESIQSFYNVASVKIGNRNYKISQNDLELLENNEAEKDGSEMTSEKMIVDYIVLAENGDYLGYNKEGKQVTKYEHNKDGKGLDKLTRIKE